MKKTVKTTLIAALALGAAPFAVSAEDSAKKQVKKYDWSKAEIALIKTDFGKGDEALNKINLALVYSMTGRTNEARKLYQDVINGQDRGYAMTKSGKPRKIKAIARDGLKMLNS